MDKRGRNCGNHKGLKETVIDWTCFDGPENKVAAYKEMGEPEKVYRLGNFTFYECPLMWITKDTVMLLDSIFLFEKSGALPLTGGQADQPLWWMEAYRLYASESSKAQEVKI